MKTCGSSNFISWQMAEKIHPSGIIRAFPFRKNRWHKYEKWISGFLLLAIFIFILSLIQFSTPNLVGNDGYYHIKMADLMRVQGLKPFFPWLPLTILNPGEFSDHHFLYHVFLMPFTIGDLILGAKWASVLFASIAFLSIWWLLRNQHIPFAGLWSLGLLAISEAFIYRMSMPRAQSLSLAILVLGLNFLLQKKFWYLLPLSFIYVWLYDAFPLMVVFAIIYIISDWLIAGKLDIQPLVFVLIGVTLGLLINPYFPDNIVFGARHLLPKLIGGADVRIGNEWYPYETTQLLENSPLGLLAFLSGVVALGLRSQRMDTRTASTLFLAIFFGLMLFQSRRFIEYFPSFALIFTAMAWAPIISNLKAKSAVQPDIDEVTQSQSSRSRNKWRRSFWMTGGVLAIIIFFGIWFTARDARVNLQNTKPAALYSQASDWLINNTPEGARIFQTDWDDFPRFFFHNTWNTYLIGLDPTYLEIKDPDLFEQWVEITHGREEFASKIIYEKFAAEYVLSDLRHERFIDRANEDPGMVEIYQDGEAIIYRVHLSEEIMD